MIPFTRLVFLLTQVDKENVPLVNGEKEDSSDDDDSSSEEEEEEEEIKQPPKKKARTEGLIFH